MSLNDKQKAISELQQWLRNISKSEDDSPAIIPDGIFSAETRLEVEKFQRERGLPVTGIADYETWEAIKLADSLVTLERELPRQVSPIRNDDLPLVKGLDNLFTDKLKLMLNHVAESYRNFELFEEEGYGDETEENIRRWQKIAFLPQTGITDKETWNSLSSFYLI